MKENQINLFQCYQKFHFHNIKIFHLLFLNHLYTLDNLLNYYKQVLDTYNAKYIKDINEIDNLINNLETYKDEFKKTFNHKFLNNDKNSESIVELYRLNYINLLNNYKKFINSEEKSTPAQIRNKMNFLV